jgi:hypothetical protein
MQEEKEGLHLKLIWNSAQRAVFKKGLGGICQGANIARLMPFSCRPENPLKNCPTTLCMYLLLLIIN